MHFNFKEGNSTLEIGSDHVTFTEGQSSKKRIAKILGVKTDKETMTIFLDSVITRWFISRDRQYECRLHDGYTTVLTITSLCDK